MKTIVLSLLITSIAHADCSGAFCVPQKSSPEIHNNALTDSLTNYVRQRTVNESVTQNMLNAYAEKTYPSAGAGSLYQQQQNYGSDLILQAEFQKLLGDLNSEKRR